MTFSKIDQRDLGQTGTVRRTGDGLTYKILCLDRERTKFRNL